MSRKTTIVEGAKFEILTDWFERKNVMLRLEGAQFEHDKGSLTVHIPIALWEFLRTIPVESTEAASLTDAGLLAEAEANIEEKIADWKAREKERRSLPAKRRRFLRSVFGNPDRPRDELLRERVGFLVVEREIARQQLRAIADYRRETSPEARRKRAESSSRFWKRQHQKRARTEAVQKRQAAARKVKHADQVDKILSLAEKHSAKR